MEKWNGLKKAITFSYDDGITQDKKFIELLDKYHLKATFNINSELLGKSGKIPYDNDGHFMLHNKNNIEEVKDIYKNHEVASHTLTHPNLTTLSKEEIIHQVEEDRLQLCKISGQNVVGFAYPCGGVNNNEYVADVIKNNTNVMYCRTITSSYSFDIPENLYRFNPTVYHLEVEKMFELAKEFVSLNTNEPKLFYIWGHSYEFDSPWINLDIMEELFKIIANRSDIFYGTNKEVFDIK